ncbi:MAG: MarR family transcriptional regulator [Alphaproteobacteria bacterium]|nr:MarR family transcriptional regulator [Alphaproteobacteria bacterium]
MSSCEDRAEIPLSELISRLGRAVQCVQFTHGLNPAQWEALRYIARANRYSRTPSALAEYLGTTKGTASQTVKALEAKGYLERRQTAADRRVSRLELTDAGSKLLALDPLRRVEASLAHLELDVQDTLQQITDLFTGMQSACGMQAFGVCQCCARFEEGLSGSATEGPHRCGLTGEALSEADSARICVNFESEQSR